MTAIALIGAASGWGAGFRHTEDGPLALRDLGLAEQLRADGVDATWRAMLESEQRWHDGATPATNEIFNMVARFNAALAEEVARTVEDGALPVVIGGDHGNAMGTWGGVARALHGKKLGLIWMDAHLDAHTVATTPSMNPHGMPAAALLGHGDARFRGICGRAIRPEHLCFIGTRSFEPEEMALLRRLGVRVIDMQEVTARGMDACMAEAHDIATRGTAGFGVTIDLDGFDPQDAPGVGLACADGLRAVPTLAALRQLGDDPRLRAVEIVEYIPEFDRDRRTADLVQGLVKALAAPVQADSTRALERSITG